MPATSNVNYDLLASASQAAGMSLDISKLPRSLRNDVRRFAREALCSAVTHGPDYVVNIPDSRVGVVEITADSASSIRVMCRGREIVRGSAAELEPIVAGLYDVDASDLC